MGWSIGYDSKWNRDIGYGVPAICDHPDCDKEIDRGLAYVCANEEPYGGDDGCGLYFCGEHLVFHKKRGFCCAACADRRKKPFVAKPDCAEWIEHKLMDESWQEWRDENPGEVSAMQAALSAIATPQGQEVARLPSTDAGDK